MLPVSHLLLPVPVFHTVLLLPSGHPRSTTEPLLNSVCVAFLAMRWLSDWLADWLSDWLSHCLWLHVTE